MVEIVRKGGTTALLSRLAALSRAAPADPLALFVWPRRLPDEAWWMSPELISIYGTGDYSKLDADTQRRLARREFVNFLSLNVHGERLLIAGIEQLLATRGDQLDPASAEYLGHFLAEERRHMRLFEYFCRRYGGKLYPDRLAAVSSGVGSGADAIFFARILCFERLADHYNRRMAGDLRLDPLVRAINAYHHAEEARHLAFGQRHLATLIAGDTEMRRRVADAAAAFVDGLIARLFNPGVYADSGMGPPFDIRRRALAHPLVRTRLDALRHECLAPLHRLLGACDPDRRTQ